MCLSDSESYIYLASINALAAFAIVNTEDILPLLIEEFQNKERTLQERINVGEIMVILSKQIGDIAPYYSKQIMHCFLLGCKDEMAEIRISSLSNMGQFCSTLRFALQSYITEVVICIESLLQTDPMIDVKRATIMFLHLMLNGLDKETFEPLSVEIKKIYLLLKRIYSTTLDDTLQLHAQLALEQIDRIGKEFWQTNINSFVKSIKI